MHLALFTHIQLWEIELDRILDIQELKNNDCLFIWNNVLNSETVPN